jgi:hypothetical protein
MVNVIFLVQHDVMGIKITPISNSSLRRFPFTMGNTIFLLAMDPVCHFLVFQFLSSTLLHQGRLLGKRIIEKGSDLMEKLLRRMEITIHHGKHHLSCCY